MTKKDYIRIANVFRNLIIDDGDIEPAMDYLKNRVIPKLMDTLEDENDLFNREKFINFIYK
jgi:hypothetical protein